MVNNMVMDEGRRGGDVCMLMVVVCWPSPDVVGEVLLASESLGTEGADVRRFPRVSPLCQ